MKHLRYYYTQGTEKFILHMSNTYTIPKTIL